MTNLNIADSKYIKMLEYNINRAYFGNFTCATADAVRNYIQQYENIYHTSASLRLDIGVINGPSICQALYHEMSYNPGRFGAESPFMVNDKDNIFKFVTSRIKSSGDNIRDKALRDIKANLKLFLQVNCEPNRKWNDVINNSSNEYIIITKNNVNKILYALSCLQAAMYTITQRNIQDLGLKTYTDKIQAACDTRHPNGVRNDIIIPNLPQITPPQTWKPDEDLLDDYVESMQHILDNPKAYSPNIVAQAKTDLANLGKPFDSNPPKKTLTPKPGTVKSKRKRQTKPKEMPMEKEINKFLKDKMAVDEKEKEAQVILDRANLLSEKIKQTRASISAIQISLNNCRCFDPREAREYADEIADLEHQERSLQAAMPSPDDIARAKTIQKATQVFYRKHKKLLINPIVVNYIATHSVKHIAGEQLEIPFDDMFGPQLVLAKSTQKRK